MKIVNKDQINLQKLVYVGATDYSLNVADMFSYFNNVIMISKCFDVHAASTETRCYIGVWALNQREVINPVITRNSVKRLGFVLPINKTTMIP